MRHNALDVSDYTKEELGTAVTRLRGSLKRAKDKGKEAGQEFMSLALQAGAAFGVGWWIGGIKSSEDFTEEDLQWWGLDKELILGLGLVFGGLTGFLGKQLSGAAKEAGKGVLAYWAGTQGEAVAMDQGED